VYVAGLTDVATSEDGNRAARLAINLEHTAMQCNAVKTIKLADCISNVRDIMIQDKKFAITYMQEKRDLLPYLSQGNKTLFDMLHNILRNAND
jgi:guanosine-3',5'-bis(diphosphate) 3'-pyrophosphohydrolase